MVYRSSRRPPANEEEEATQLHECTSLDSDDSNKEVKYLSQNGRWKMLCIFLGLLSLCLAIGLIVTASGGSSSIPLCGKGSNSVQRVIDISEPDQPGPFHDLTKREIEKIFSFLHNDPSIKLKKEDYKMTDPVVFTMDLLPPKKSEVQAFLDGKQRQPERQARVILFRRDLNPPMVHELACGPLPRVSRCSLIESNTRRNPVEYSVRPLGFPQDMQNLYEILLAKVDKQIGYILRESYGTSYANCDPKKCFRFYPSPVGTNLVGNINYRKMWMSALYPVEYYGEYPVDFAMLGNLESVDPTEHYISNIWYHGQFFKSVDEFIVKYNGTSIKKTRMRPPAKKAKDSFSSLYQRGHPVPKETQRPPILVEPDGKRYSLKNRQVEYMDWKFNFRMSAVHGPSLGNIRFRGERIAYELSLEDIAVFYSSNNPVQRSTDYVDSSAFIGTNAKSLVPGGDCPEVATFISQTFPSQEKAQAVRIKRTFCLFENNNGYPARRHLSYSQFEGAFYGGMLESVLTLRSILTVVNYDYVVDFIFHQTGAVQTRVMSTGYILPTFYYPSEDPYGFNIEQNFLAPLHHHMFHFKADLDVSGTSNRYETLDIKPDIVNLRINPDMSYHQTRFERSLKKTEMDALYKYDFDHPKYHVVHNNDKRTEFGQIKAYRIHMEGMSKQIHQKGQGNEETISWARHQLVVTKHKDEEHLSSSPYAMYDSFKPVTNFSKFYSDNETIVDEDLVFWIACGVHHIPHAEDLPITPTVGAHLQFFLLPYNYFSQCPSVSSRDNIHIKLKDPNKPDEGVTINRHGYKHEQCKTPQYAAEYDELIRNDPDVVIESRESLGLF